MKNAGLYIVALVCLLGLRLSVGEEQQSDDCVICNADEALSYALIYSGFEEAIGFDPDTCIRDIKQTVMTDSTTPFFHDELTGTKAWVISFDNIIFDFYGVKEEHKLQTVMRFDVFVDVSTGMLLKIESPENNDDKGLIPIPSVDKLESDFNSRSDTLNVLYNRKPLVSFYQAVVNDKMRSVINARKIHAMCAMNSRLEKEAVPMWIITGFDPAAMPFDSDIRYDRKNVYSRRAWLLVDAMTGDVIIIHRKTMGNEDND